MRVILRLSGKAARRPVSSASIVDRLTADAAAPPEERLGGMASLAYGVGVGRVVEVADYEEAPRETPVEDSQLQEAVFEDLLPRRALPPRNALPSAVFGAAATAEIAAAETAVPETAAPAVPLADGPTFVADTPVAGTAAASAVDVAANLAADESAAEAEVGPLAVPPDGPIPPDAPPGDAAAGQTPPPAVREEETAKAAKPAARTGLRCKRCGSRDVWRFGRVTSFQAMIASMMRGQWITCRKCGKRFVSDFYGPMRRGDEDDDSD